ncbi:male sterility protein-domain-containing protein [Annulohypoxylon stygium]|nr:male sterility protein-domain-containing protein [Annulohypoxylon stygium]
MAYSGQNYFTCTLGEAARLRKRDGDQNSFKTVLELIETQARCLPGHPALGFANYASDPIFYQCTSSGIPKPMPQTQWGAVGCLPCFSDINQPSTFTTTPLYHGGLADCFRAWTSGAMVWLFPEGVVPITGTNIVHSIAYARERCSIPVKYFSSVPYVLQLLVEEEEGIRTLRSMELVGVGGAALAPSIGDKLVKLRIRLVSRMGSAECGFLMSSHRDYVEDKDWQYLRPTGGSSLLTFEPRDGGLSELIIKPNWPLMTIVNRDDGSYATSDLFESHPSIQNAWRYHSRADSQITLANGKKFDPSPLEESIKASTHLVRDVLIFGAGKDYVGALLFKMSNDYSDKDVIEDVWPQVQKLNKNAQSHSRLTKSMLIPVDPKQKETLAKSSKGTILRRQAETRYADMIERSYTSGGTPPINNPIVSDADLSSFILDLFAQVLGREIDPRGDIRKLIESHIFPEGSPKLPLNNLTRMRHCNELMRKLADKYSELQVHNINSHQKDGEKDGEVIVLTGATGTLGVHILSALCNDARVRKVYCLLRSPSRLSAQERVLRALSGRELPKPHLDASRITDGKVICLPCQLTDVHLALSSQERTRIVTEATVFIHAAWSVNFSLRLNSFEDHISGTRNLINMAVSSSARCFFISSTAAVSSNTSFPIMEKASLDPSHASPLGYSRSKWVAEQVCTRVRERLFGDMSTLASKNTDISVIRVGQLCGNEAGVWNSSEAYPLMLSTAGFTECLPDLPNEILDWIPADQAAKIILELTLPENDTELLPGSEVPVYHVLNPHRSPTWNQLLRWISEAPGGPSFQIVQPAEWLQRLESSLGILKAGHPSQALLGLWRQKYAGTTIPPRLKAECRSTKTPVYPIFDITSSSRLSQTMVNIQPLNRDRIMRMWTWVWKNMTGRNDKT